MVDQDIIVRLLSNVEGFVSDLRAATDITHEHFLQDIRSQRFVERTLQVAVEASMDVAHHIISDERWREPDSYADAFVVLAENSVISSEAAGRCRLMAQFRNKIVHYYEKVDPEQVFAIFSGHLGDFDEYVKAVRLWLQQHQEGNPEE